MNVNIAAGATLDLAGSSETIGSLNDANGSGGEITNSAAGTAELQTHRGISFQLVNCV